MSCKASRHKCCNTHEIDGTRCRSHSEKNLTIERMCVCAKFNFIEQKNKFMNMNMKLDNW